jgi:membrane-bound lytic murein transglycosylase D
MHTRRPLQSVLALALAAAGLAGCVPNRPVAPAAPAPVWQPEPEELGDGPEIVEERVTAPKRDILGSVSYDLPVEANSWVEAELDFLVEQRRDVIARWIERGDFYEAFVKEELRAQGVPTDLFHLAMIESGFLPTARSRVGAVGMWQFMPATGRAMGLRIDGEVDERMDPIRSTRAAAKHLRDLKRSMGTWALAAAAYNAGPGRINRGLRETSAENFWQLAERGDLAEETKHYVPRLYAMTVIARGRDRFGFAAASSPSFAFDSIHVEYATPLQELARMGDVSINELTSLNPHLVGGVAPSGGYWVWVPVNEGPGLQRAYLASDFRKERGYGTYVVRRGDYLGRIAERSGVGSRRIRELNPRVEFDPLQIGVKLRLPYAAAEKLTKRAEEPEAEAPAEPRVAAKAEPAPERNAASASTKTESSASRAPAARTHEVRSGETLWEIARKNDVSVEALQQANGLDGATIRPGMELRIPAAEGEPAAPELAEHVVKGGETLWGIARKYGSSVEAIQKANELGERPIRPGQKLAIPL